MSRTIKIGRGRASVEMTGGLRDVMERVLSQRTYKRLADRLDQEAADLLREARAQWPVSHRKGRRPDRSKDALQSGLRLIPPHTIEAFVEIDPRSKAIDYAFYIKSAKVRSAGGHAYNALLRNPARRRGKKLAKELGELLVALASPRAG